MSKGSLMEQDGIPEMRPTDLPSRLAPRFTMIAATAPIFGLVCGCAVFYVLYDHFGWWAGRALDAGIRTWGWFVAVGFIGALIGLMRREKWRGLTAIALLFNGIALVSFWLKNMSLWPGVWPEP